MNPKHLQPVLKTAIMLLAFLLLVKPGVAVPVQHAPDVDRIDAFVLQQMQRHHLPGLALALVDGDQIIFMKGYGKADQSGRLITPQTPFLLASVSKPITAAAVMQLVEAGQIALDAPLQHYVPDFRLADPIASAQITVRHLLLHTSGIPVTACDTRGNAVTLAEYVAELRTVPLAAPPGTRYSYCSGNYNLLGRIIETVSGQSYDSYIKQHIFDPLDMQHSFTSEMEAQRAGMAQGYQWVFGRIVPTQYRYNPSQLPSGYLISSVEDMSHFLISQLNGGRFVSTNLLSPDSTAVMQVSGVQRGADSGYGFGWIIGPVGGIPAVWHDGVHPNFHSLLLMQPETRRGAVILTNAFSIVAYESAYRELENGVARLLAGQEPISGAEMNLGTVYLIIDMLLAVSLALAFWPLLNIGRWHRWLLDRQHAGRMPLVRVILRAVREIILALVFLLAIRLLIIPSLGAQSWYEVFEVFPDFVGWIWLFAVAGLITGGIRLALILRTYRASTPAAVHRRQRVPDSFQKNT